MLVYIALWIIETTIGVLIRILKRSKHEKVAINKMVDLSFIEVCVNPVLRVQEGDETLKNID